MSGASVKDQILEQKIFLLLFSLRKLQEFWELSARNQGQKPIYIFSIYIYIFFFYIAQLQSLKKKMSVYFLPAVVK